MVSRLIELIKEKLIKHKPGIISNLVCKIIYYSMNRICFKVSLDSFNEEFQPSSNQEEADTKLLDTRHALDSIKINVLSFAPLQQMWISMFCSFQHFRKSQIIRGLTTEPVNIEKFFH